MSEEHIVVHRPKWSLDLLPLICGIANAGGGSLLITANDKRHPWSIRKMRKPFETIPSIVQQRLGIVCTAEPVMEGVSFCLEIAIPAAEEPLSFDGTFYLYQDNRNVSLTQKELYAHYDAENRTSEPEEPQTYIDNDGREVRVSTSSIAPASRKATFEERSIAAAHDVDMTITDEYVLKVLKANGRTSAARMAQLLNVSESTIRRSLKRLKELGFIKRVGSNKAGYWKTLM